MEKYILQRIYENEKIQYLSAIYRTSTSTTTDIGDALEFTNKEVALAICNELNERQYTGYTFKVLAIKTVIEEIK